MPSLPDIRERTLLHAFERALKNAPDKVAQLERGARYTYNEVYQRSLAVPGGLLVGRGTPSPRSSTTRSTTRNLLFGLGLVGAIQVAINTAYKGRFLAHLLTDSRATVLVIEEHMSSDSCRSSMRCRSSSPSSSAALPRRSRARASACSASTRCSLPPRRRRCEARSRTSSRTSTRRKPRGNPKASACRSCTRTRRARMTGASRPTIDILPNDNHLLQGVSHALPFAFQGFDARLGTAGRAYLAEEVDRRRYAALGPPPY